MSEELFPYFRYFPWSISIFHTYTYKKYREKESRRIKEIIYILLSYIPLVPFRAVLRPLLISHGLGKYLAINGTNLPTAGHPDSFLGPPGPLAPSTADESAAIKGRVCFECNNFLSHAHGGTYD